MKKLLAGFVIIFSLILSSCSKRNPERNMPVSGKPEEITIGLSVDTLIIERWHRDCDTFISKTKECGADVIVQNAANSVSVQIRQIEYLINRGVNVLVIIPKKADSLTEVLEKAKARNIPIISYDRLIRNANVNLYLTVDSFSAGKFMAEKLKDVQPKGSYFCIYGSEDDFNMTLMDRGVNEALVGTEITIPLKYFTPEWNYDLAYSRISSLLDEKFIPDAVICGNDAVAESVLRALSEHRLGNRIPVVGQDADVLACRRILDGTQVATIYKPIQKLAETAAEWAYSLATGAGAEQLESLEKINNGYSDVPVVWLEPVPVTKENLKEVIVDSGFHSYSDIYR